MEKVLNHQGVKWGLLVTALVIIPFWPLVWPCSALLVLISLHALQAKVPLQPFRLVGAFGVWLSLRLLDFVQTSLPQLDHPEVFLVVPWLLGVNMLIGGFLPRVRRLLRPGRLLGLGLIWLAFYLSVPTTAGGAGTLGSFGWLSWTFFGLGAVSILVGDYRHPAAGLQDLRGDSYWHGQRLSEQEEAVRAGGREGEQAVRTVLESLPRRQYSLYHGVHLRSKGRNLPRSQELDHLVVGPNGVFNLETKNWHGKVSIAPSGQWSRIGSDGTAKPWESPAEQVERHHQVLDSLLADLHVPIIDCLVLTNPTTVISGMENTKLRIIRVQQLQQLVANWQSDRPLGPQQLAEINRRIKANIIPSAQFETGGRFVWRLWHWLVVDGAAIGLFFWLTVQRGI